MKNCPQCKTEKPDDEFYADKSKATGLSSNCKECVKARSLKVKQCPEWAKNHHLHKTYGLTVEDVEEVSQFQDHKCAICGTEESNGKNGVFHVDHCHSTGEVRGLLCFSCNALLGHARDNTDTLEEAVRYLNAFKD